MEFRDELPLMIYDDKCYVCIKFAKLMNFIAKGKLRMIGHYTRVWKDDQRRNSRRGCIGKCFGSSIKKQHMAEEPQYFH